MRYTVISKENDKTYIKKFETIFYIDLKMERNEVIMFRTIAVLNSMQGTIILPEVIQNELLSL